jgi:hypothetical protein
VSRGGESLFIDREERGQILIMRQNYSWERSCHQKTQWGFAKRVS